MNLHIGEGWQQGKYKLLGDTGRNVKAEQTLPAPNANILPSMLTISSSKTFKSVYLYLVFVVCSNICKVLIANQNRD